MPPFAGKKPSVTERRREQLSQALNTLSSSTRDAKACCNQLYSRSRQLDSLASPASDASSMLSRANANLAATIVLLKDAREKFDTVADVEPVVDRLQRGVKEWEDGLQGTKRRIAGRVVLTEQDVYSASDSMEVLRDTHAYFSVRPSWKSSPSVLAGLERVHQIGLDSMCRVVYLHLQQAGPAVRPQRSKKATNGVTAAKETPAQTRQRLSAALQNRDLLKSIGEYEDHQPVDARPVRELTIIFEGLASHGYNIQKASTKREPPGLRQIFGLAPQSMIRTEKVGSGGYCNFVKQKLETGFPQLDEYAAARQKVAFNSLDTFYRKLKADRKRLVHHDEADAAARDAVRCIEHTMLLAAGEKNVYREVVAPSFKRPVEEYEDDEDARSPFYRKACVAAYSYVVAALVDRTLDIIETVFLKEGGIGQSINKSMNASTASGAGVLTVRVASSAAAAGLRMLDGVRMLGPSLAKLCEMSVNDGETKPNSSLAAILCIAIHRTTVKNCARTLEGLSKAIQEDPLKGPLHRPKDASVSVVTSDVVEAIRKVSPFVSAYKSVSKRRALPWDPNLGEESGELDSFVRFIVMRLLNSLKGKALNYTKDGRDDSAAKSSLFMINNGFHLIEELKASSENDEEVEEKDEETYTITGSWFVDKINKIMDSEKAKYLEHWEKLNTHLTAVGSGDLEYQKKDTSVLSLESGRLIKGRFSGFNEDFERNYALHKKLCIVDPRLRVQLQGDVSEVFLPRYRRFYEKYTAIRFSKKKQEEYTKFSPSKIESMLADLYTDPEPLPPRDV